MNYTRTSWILMGFFLAAIYGFMAAFCWWASEMVFKEDMPWFLAVFIPMGVFSAVMCIDVLIQLLTGKSALRALSRRLQ